MELVTHKKFKGDRLMPWGRGTVVTGAKGFFSLPATQELLTTTLPFRKGVVP